MRTPGGEAIDGKYPVFADQYKFNPGRILIANVVDKAGVPIVEFMAARVTAVCMKPPQNANKLKRVDKDLLISDPILKKFIRTLWISFSINTTVVCVDEYSNGITEIRSFSEPCAMWAVRRLQKYISRIESDPEKFVISIIRNNQILNLANETREANEFLVSPVWRDKIRIETSGDATEWKRMAYSG